MRRVANVDRNQAEIVDRLRQLGCSVIPLHQVGGGCPDLLIGFKAKGIGPCTVLMEVKDGEKPPSARVLTKDQRKFFARFRGAACVIESADEAEQVVTAMRLGDFGVIRRAPFSDRLPYPDA